MDRQSYLFFCCWDCTNLHLKRKHCSTIGTHRSLFSLFELLIVLLLWYIILPISRWVINIEPNQSYGLDEVMDDMFNLRVFKTMTNGFLSVYNDSLNKMIWISVTYNRFELHLTCICIESYNWSLLSKICLLRKVTKRYRVLTQCRVYGINSQCGVQVLLLCHQWQDWQRNS